MRQFLVVAGILAGLSSAGHAVVIARGSGTGNTTAAGFSQWDNVGAPSAGHSAVYLGYGWVMQSAHQQTVVSGTVTFAGVPYTIDTASVVRLKNADTTDTDARLYKLTTLPPLSPLTLASSSPAAGTTVRMIGNGRTEPAGTYPSNVTYWDITGGVWTDQGNSSAGAEAAGYKWSVTGTKRWGENTIYGSLTTSNYGQGNVTMSQTLFDEFDDAVAAAGDSGGGLFLADGTLVGMNTTISQFTGQPGNASVFPIGSVATGSYALDIATYRTQILAIVPEPSVVMLLGGLGFVLVGRRPRRAE